MPELAAYEPIVGRDVVNEIRQVALALGGRSVLHVNSTAVGGGVAEILMNMVPLLTDLGVPSRWDVIKGGERFFAFTKRVHNALHGKPEEVGPEDIEAWDETTALNLQSMDLGADFVFIHDPQPIGLVQARRGQHNHWVWRCHVDVSAPFRPVWDLLAPWIEQYDAAVFSAPSFARDLRTRQVLIAPSIDPLSAKNRDLPPEQVEQIVTGYGIDTKRPILTQISRFDHLKDPLGVVEVYKRVKRTTDCQLVLAGGGASDDPEGPAILAAVEAAAAGDPDIHVLFLPPASDIEINALQRASTVILQKSLKEGFGLTVSEALWKAKPVVASAVGGIPLQIAHSYSGLLSHTIDGTAFWVRQLLHEPEFAKRLGENGKEHVRQNYLITRHVRDYLLLFLSLLHDEDLVYF